MLLEEDRALRPQTDEGRLRRGRRPALLELPQQALTLRRQLRASEALPLLELRPARLSLRARRRSLVLERTALAALMLLEGALSGLQVGRSPLKVAQIRRHGLHGRLRLLGRYTRRLELGPHRRIDLGGGGGGGGGYGGLSTRPCGCCVHLGHVRLHLHRARRRGGGLCPVDCNLRLRLRCLDSYLALTPHCGQPSVQILLELLQAGLVLALLAL